MTRTKYNKIRGRKYQNRVLNQNGIELLCNKLV